MCPAFRETVGHGKELYQFLSELVSMFSPYLANLPVYLDLDKQG